MPILIPKLQNIGHCGRSLISKKFPTGPFERHLKTKNGSARARRFHLPNGLWTARARGPNKGVCWIGPVSFFLDHLDLKYWLKDDRTLPRAKSASLQIAFETSFCDKSILPGFLYLATEAAAFHLPRTWISRMVRML